MLIDIVTQVGRWRRIRANRRVLETLDERALKDVGLHRRAGTPDGARVMLRTLGLR